MGRRKKTKTVVIPYKPRLWAMEFHESPARHKVLVCHRRAGKTVALINHLQRDALRTPKSRFAYIAPTYKQAKRVAWDIVKEYSGMIPDIQYNESELRVDYPNGSRLSLYGADNPDALRGIDLWGAGFDEYSQQPSTIYSEVIGPALANHGGYAIWIGTPKGKNAFFRRYEKATREEDSLAILLKASESGILSDDELKHQRKEMTAEEYNQEFECSFNAALRGAYYKHELAEAKAEGRICNVPLSREHPVHTFWDIGVNDTTAILFVQVVDKEIRVIDYYENNGVSLDYYVAKIKSIANTRKFVLGSHYLPHDVMARELGTGKSRYEILRSLLGNIQVVPRLSIKDGIEAARLTFNKIWFDEHRVLPLLDALHSYSQEWDSKKGDWKDKPKHDWSSHPADAFRYMCVGLKTKAKNHKYGNIGMRKYRNGGGKLIAKIKMRH